MVIKYLRGFHKARGGGCSSARGASDETGTGPDGSRGSFQGRCEVSTPRTRLPVAADSLGSQLLRSTVPAALGRVDGRGIRCLACAHACQLASGQTGLCGVRANVDGTLRAPWGYVARRHARAVETNTVFHVRPGGRGLTFGMYGCDLRCPYCHNWRLSQALREDVDDEGPQRVTPAALVEEALRAGCQVLCAAYNEPMIAAEWVRDVFEEARRAGLTTAVISDGNATAEALEWLRPVTDVYRVDVKAASDEGYRDGGRPFPTGDGRAREGPAPGLLGRGGDPGGVERRLMARAASTSGPLGSGPGLAGSSRMASGC
jgi:hypothetical protein